MVVPKAGRPQYRPQNTIVLIMGTPQNGTPNFGKPPHGCDSVLLYNRFGLCKALLQDRIPALYQHVVLRLLSGRIPNPPYYLSPIKRGHPGQPKITFEGFGFRTRLMG